MRLRSISPAAAVLVTGVIIASYIVMFASPGMDDMGTWKMFAEGIMRHGMAYIRTCLSPVLCDGYPSVYPPMYVGLLAAGSGLIFTLFHPYSFYIVKYTIFLFFLFTVAAAAWYGSAVSGKRGKRNGAVFAVLMTVSSVSVFLNTEALGLVDVLTFPFLILSVLAYYRRNMFWFGVFFAVTFLTKWQATMYLPLMVAVVWRDDGIPGLFRYILGVGSGMFIVWAVLLFFPLATFAESFLAGSIHQPMSAAPNFPWITEMILFREPFATMFQVPVSTFPYMDATVGSSTALWAVYWGWKAVSIIFYGMVVYLVCRREEYGKRGVRLLTGMVLVSFAYFLFSTGVHDNHLMLGVISALLLSITDASVFHQKLYRFVDWLNALGMFLFNGLTGTPLIYLGRSNVTVMTVGAVIFILGSVVILMPLLGRLLFLKAGKNR